MDISATTGLATLDRIVTLVPNSLQSDFETDLGEFKQLVSVAYDGHETLLAKNVTLECPPGLSDIRNNISIRHIGRVCFDIPSTAYELCHSQRHTSLAENAEARKSIRAWRSGFLTNSALLSNACCARARDSKSSRAPSGTRWRAYPFQSRKCTPCSAPSGQGLNCCARGRRFVSPAWDAHGSAPLIT
ncbi:hypothetical protein QTI24_24510 [Variovorax sp. J22P240]|uniref:hypothetical protein n=1 Tax=Variovorax sp. J22P240 TaxID=3053514 RepID=UPI002574E7F6|nr:hypothetical protein [Variovorax sp. J22P240]MDM0001793.1 hypothetical protein [Variovorax sp. J22P240]